MALHQPAFRPRCRRSTPTTPQERNGFVTFGTMNNPYKYNAGRDRDLGRGRCGGVPDSQFLFVRPESAVPVLPGERRRALRERTASQPTASCTSPSGAGTCRTTTTSTSRSTLSPRRAEPPPARPCGWACRASRWSARPSIERLSYSNLNNAGLGECCTFDRAEFVAKAIDIAGRTRVAHRAAPHHACAPARPPLGHPMLFVDDFQDTLLRWMDEQP